MPLSDFKLNSINTTKTSFFSPSICSLPNDDVQFTGNHSLIGFNPLNSGSILIRAYSAQEIQKSAYAS